MALPSSEEALLPPDVVLNPEATWRGSPGIIYSQALGCLYPGGRRQPFPGDGAARPGPLRVPAPTPTL